MRAHLSKNEFKFVAISVMVLEVAAFLVFIFGTLGAILGTYSGISTTDFILLGFGGIFVALMLMAIAEVLQVMMRIEHNTRKENTLLQQQMQVQKDEVKATKNVATLLKKVSPMSKPSAQAKIKKPAVKKMKPKRK